MWLLVYVSGARAVVGVGLETPRGLAELELRKNVRSEFRWASGTHQGYSID